MVFRDERRQRFLDETRYKERDADLVDRIPYFGKQIWEEGIREGARGSFAWTVASENLELLLLRYTAGRPLAELREQLPAVISAFDAFIPLDIPEHPNEAHTLEITQLEAYVFVMWLLALSRLLGHERLIPNVIGWLDRNAEFNRGRDTIFERVVEKLTGNMQDPGRYSLHIDAYRPLGRAILAEDPAERPALVKEFVENWYKHMKECYWYGIHADKDLSSYFGYWCLEAALVTFLWDIDDTSYRDHLVYPKDLVAYARENFPLRDPSAPSADTRLRCLAGQPCPKAGYWLTPAKADSRRLFKAGEIMPRFEGDYGETIWQWDEKQ
jgi:hypothetical protein